LNQKSCTKNQVEILCFKPKIDKEEAIKIARKKPFLRREKGQVTETNLMYKPFMIFKYEASIRKKKIKDAIIENITFYIAIDMITGLGFEFEKFDEDRVDRIFVENNQIIKESISINKAMEEASRIAFKFKLKLSKFGFEVLREEVKPIGMIYKPLWIIKFINKGRESIVGVDAIKGTRV